MNWAIFIVGLLVLGAGLFAQFYTQTTTETDSTAFGFSSDTDTMINAPYQAAAIPLIFIGAVLIILGVLIRPRV